MKQVKISLEFATVTNDFKISVLQTTNINFSFIIHVQCEFPRVLAQCTYSGPILVEIPLNT